MSSDSRRTHCLRRDCHTISRTHDFRMRGRVRLPIVTNWPRARRIGDNRKTYASLRVRVTQAESTHESTSNGRTWLRATSQARGVITSPSRRGGRVHMRHGPGASGPSRGSRRQAERSRPRAPGRACTRGRRGVPSRDLSRSIFHAGAHSGQARLGAARAALACSGLTLKVLSKYKKGSCRLHYSAEVQRTMGAARQLSLPPRYRQT
jgi:hypothetical protein